jgi:hypothetical protein
MACNCAVCICRRSNAQFSAEEIPSGGLSFVRLVSTMSVYGTNAKCRLHRAMSEFGGKAETCAHSELSDFDPKRTACWKEFSMCSCLP